MSGDVLFWGIIQPLSDNSSELPHSSQPYSLPALHYPHLSFLFLNITQAALSSCPGNFEWIDMLIGIITTNGPSHPAIQGTFRVAI